MAIKNSKNKTRKNKAGSRKSPLESATDFPEGTIKLGNNKQQWVVEKVSNGSQRWIPYESVELFGYKALTVDYLASHIGKPVKIYEREYSDMWPPKSNSKLYVSTFTPNGNAGPITNKKRIEGWLKTQKPPIKDRTVFTIDGSGDGLDSLQVDSISKTRVSSNMMNQEAFVKI
jgi:hypothetical protein